jgi:hypothetical protein
MSGFKQSICPECRAEIDPRARRCRYCGSKILRWDVTAVLGAVFAIGIGAYACSYIVGSPNTGGTPPATSTAGGLRAGNRSGNRAGMKLVGADQSLVAMAAKERKAESRCALGAGFDSPECETQGELTEKLQMAGWCHEAPIAVPDPGPWAPCGPDDVPTRSAHGSNAHP